MAPGSPTDGFSASRSTQERQQRQDWHLLLILVGIILGGVAVMGVAFGMA